MKYDDILNEESSDTPILSEPVMTTYVSTAHALNMENVWYFLNSLDNTNKRIIAYKLLDQIDEASFPGLTDEEMNIRIANAENDIKMGRTLSAEEAHKKLEERYPWLCD